MRLVVLAALAAAPREGPGVLHQIAYRQLARIVAVTAAATAATTQAAAAVLVALPLMAPWAERQRPMWHGVVAVLTAARQAPLRLSVMV
jgi:hypothetical protein